jgi:hypothetical protein
MRCATSTGGTTVAAYFTLGNKHLGVCKALSISLQAAQARRAASAVIIPFRKPVNRSARRLSDPRDR